MFSDDYERTYDAQRHYKLFLMIRAEVFARQVRSANNIDTIVEKQENCYRYLIWTEDITRNESRFG